MRDRGRRRALPVAAAPDRGRAPGPFSLSDATSAADDDLRTALFGCGILMTGLIASAPLPAGPVIRLLPGVRTASAVADSTV
ncbi:hypothetical protein [Streptomyces sp. PTD5-9]|uniref:hypothetical protein n=1 Tax=Streptomyces sp. PTD5-9 TaxID=3120150 RepID=UPI00300AB97F